MKKFIAAGLAIALSLAMLTACADNTSGDSTTAENNENTTEEESTTTELGEVLEVSFWSAPNQDQFDFWSAKADEFNATNTQVNGYTINVAVQQMPETPSSEAGIQNAIATGTVPAASENINVGFAAVLEESEVVYSLSDEDWFTEICENRSITDEMLDGWEINDNQYVIPLYINPMSLQWNKVALDALGKDVPTTVDEFNDVIQAFIDNEDGSMAEIGVTHTFYRPALIRGDQWWERWYDFQMQYMSFSDGGAWVENNELVLDQEAVEKVFELYGNLGDTVMTSEITNVWTSETVPILFSISAPWEVSTLSEAGKEYDVDYVYGPTLVEEEGDTAYSYADSKGIVFYKTDSISEDEHLGVVEFVKWVYSADQSSQSDLDWWTKTDMMPVRGDLTTNETFSSVIDEAPALGAIAEYIDEAVPCMSNANMTEIQTALGDAGFTPYFLITSELEPFNAPDASTYVEAAFEAMITDGELDS